jgi:hypothetical protein
MEDRAKKLTRSCEPSKVDTFDLDTLLHPASRSPIRWTWSAMPISL